VEQSTPGRRRARDGAVTVAELVSRQPSTVQQALHQLGVERVEAEPEPGTGEVDDGRIGPDTDGPRIRPVLRVAAVAASVLALCGAVTAAGIITSGRTGQFTQQRAASTEDSTIEGVAGLRPDVLDHDLSRPNQQQVAPDSPPPMVVTNTPIGPTPTATAAPNTTTHPPRTTSPPLVDPAIDVVKRFFHLLPVEPNNALGLVEPNLLGRDRPGFLNAWKSVRFVSVQRMENRPDGKVFAAVILHHGNGDRMYVEQLLTVTRSNPRRIKDVQLVSAQQI
jgi:hypothetical protein